MRRDYYPKTIIQQILENLSYHPFAYKVRTAIVTVV